MSRNKTFVSGVAALMAIVAITICSNGVMPFVSARTLETHNRIEQGVPELKAFQDAVAAVLAAPPTTDAKKLMKERTECAQQELALRLEDFNGGRGTLDICLDAARRVHDSALDLVRNAEQELMIRKAYVAILKYVEKLNQDRFNSGMIKQQDLLLTKYDRLEAEIQLLKHGGKMDAQPAK